MKIILLSIAAATLSFAAVVHADPQVTSETAAPASGSSVTITARRYHMEPQEFMDYEYSYNMDNGEHLIFSRRVGRFYVAVKGHETVEMFATGRESFITRAGAKLLFAEDGDALTIDNFERLVAASGPQPAATTAAAKP